MNVQKQVYIITCRIKDIKSNEIRKKLEKNIKTSSINKFIRELINKFMWTEPMHDETIKLIIKNLDP